MAHQFGYLWLARPCFTRYLDRRSILLQTATGIAQPRPMHTRAAVELPTTATNRGVFFAMILTTNGTWLHTDRTDRCFVHMTYGCVFSAERVTTIQLLSEMISAKGLVAEVAMAHAMLAAFFATLRTRDGVGDQLAAMGTFFKAIQTVGSAARIDLVEAWAYLPPTLATGN